MKTDDPNKIILYFFWGLELNETDYFNAISENRTYNPNIKPLVIKYIWDDNENA